MSRENGMSGFGRLVSRLLFVPESNVAAAQMGRTAYRDLQDWYDNPRDEQALQGSVASYRNALRSIAPDHPQRAQLEEQLGASQRDLWIATGHLDTLGHAIETMAASATRTPPADVGHWLGRRWMLMLLHVLRYGAARDASDARLADDCHRSMAPMLSGSYGQPWSPDLRAAILLAAAQLDELRGGGTAAAPWIEQARQALGRPLSPAAGPGVSTWCVLLIRRGRLLMEQYESTHDDQLCRQALALADCGIAAFGEQPGHPVRLFELRGRLLFTRFRLRDRRDYALAARRDFEATLRLVAPEHVQWRADLQWHLALLIVALAPHEPLDDADAALAHRLAAESLAVVPPGSVDHALHVLLMADVRHLFPAEPDAAYLRETAAWYERALALLDGGDHAWPAHSKIAKLLGDLYDATGDPTHLSSAIGHAEAALRLCPPRFAPQNAPVLHSGLGTMLRLRHERTGDRRDYERALEHTGKGVSLAPFPGSAPQWSMRLSNHAVVLALPGRPQDHAAAERLLNDALESRDLTPQDEALLHQNLGTILRQAADLLQDRDQLQSGVRHLRRAVTVMSPHEALGRLACRNLAAALHSLWLVDRDPALLDEALEVVDAALAAVPDGAPDQGLLLSDRGTYLVSRGVHHEEQDDAERAHRDTVRAVETLRRALEVLPPEHIVHPMVQAQYSEALHSVGLLTGDLRSRQEALAAHRRAVEALDVDSPSRALPALLLATALVNTEDPTPEEEGEAVDLCLWVARHPSGPPATRWEAAVKAAELLVGRDDWAGALEACELAIAVLPRLAWGGLTFDDRLHALSDTSHTVCDAAAIALNAGAPERALEILEHGRGQLLAHALDMGIDLEAVRRQDPGLAAELDLARDERAATRGGDPGHAGTRRRRRQQDWDQLVERVRQLPGLAGFLRPAACRELLAVAEEGPVVVLNSSHFRSDALVLHGGTLTVVPLPQFRHDKAVLRAQALSRLVHPPEAGDEDEEYGDQHAELRPYLADLLDWLWTTVAEPVLKVLPAVPVRDEDGRPPRIWWCPTGVFNHLPVHAATRLDDVSGADPVAGSDRTAGDSLGDRYVSSLTPTLRALLTARAADRAHSRVTSRAGAPLLLVGVGGTPPGTDLDELRHVAREIDAVARLFPTTEPLCDADAVRATVLRRLRAGGWFHFAGHGEQNPEEPDGLLYLWDHSTSDSLRIRDIAGLRLDRAELAFLSACQTHLAPRAHSDEPVSLAGALQLAGFRHVVAAQWQLSDLRAHRVTTSFYENLLKSADVSSAAPAPTARDAAHALHAAVRERRRERPEALEVWAAYVHLGP
ncbi:CHAT domain-containing protein [Streptomyces sp. NBC_00233]|uniref:CHAT domain-containing protein n=1 Tax=Streptomyces sp. NBC_00233 TaxID=2975686 RepID=UPI002259BCB3|nr:CHAT domain-containing protein [Streptomyces sp. NBC_00233]MCX5230056.1 CHAT domain-containing protein [Streptomyces sp. NBC_00233]